VAVADPEGFAEKRCLVTGGTSGIGRATASALGRLGAHVTITARDPNKARLTCEAIRVNTGNDRVDFEEVDLASQESIGNFLRRFRARCRRLDVLVNDAGVYRSARETTADGLERTFAVNHEAYFLLTLGLLDRLRASPAGRVVNVASEAHRGARLRLDDLQGERSFNGQRAYAQSKLANIMFTYALCRRVPRGRPSVNALHPGVVRTNWAHQGIGIVQAGVRLLSPFMLSPERGADTVVYLATDPSVSLETGLYWVRRRPRPSSRASYDEAAQEALWDASLRLVRIPLAGASALERRGPEAQPKTGEGPAGRPPRGPDSPLT
jgi:NAD(P)-dependent dehydrogenase (short-subunit alcohol dehydrogenase family)